ncbi:hypothetical protein [Nocardioides coralli]|uniref:hypothetical protein n=1 Tax=Nocardioides coralli TaxID=2872154 RepID=UPI001CA42117|nr:hypothetical protein [Nocardioides coralli]QZY28772.1 hypothetical protein K6T13_15135 [Nocardioides coralli]
MATFDIKTASKPFYAGVGVTDLAVELVRDYVTEAQKRFADVQKNVSKIELEPRALRDQATTVVNSRVDAISKDAKARRAAIEKRITELQGEALELPAKVGDVYGDLVVRGEGLVTRVRKQESTKRTASNAKTTTTKAKTTGTQAKKASKSTAKSAKSTAKKTTSTAKKSSSPAQSSAKATATAAKKTAESAAEAATDAAAKVGD